MVGLNDSSDEPPVLMMRQGGGEKENASTLLSSTAEQRVMVFTPLEAVPPTIYEDAVLDPAERTHRPTPRYPSSSDHERKKLQQLTLKLRREKRRLFLESVAQDQARASLDTDTDSRASSPDKDFKAVAKNFKRLKMENDYGNLTKPFERPNVALSRARAA